MGDFRFAAFLVCALALGCYTLSAGGSEGPYDASIPRLTVNLTPEFDAQGNANALGVHYRIEPIRADDDRPVDLLIEDIEPFGRTTDQITSLVVTDRHGVISTAMAAKGEGDRRLARHPADWLEVSYRVPVALRKPPRRGPQVELQGVGESISTSGADVLVLPVGMETFDTHLRWNLPRGMSGVASFGEGDVSSRLERRTLLSSIYLAGHIYRYTGSNNDGLEVYGVGSASYDFNGLFQWVDRWRQVMRSRLPGAAEHPLHIFFRAFDGGMMSASGYTPDGTVMLYLPPSPSPDQVWSTKLVIAHETIHAWTRGFDEDAPEAAWYGEGMADFLAVTLPYQAGLYSPREFQALVNGRAATYYGNARRDLPENQVEDAMWAGADAWTTHYMRGFMYLADLDAKLRKQSAGHVQVVDLIDAVRARQARGEHANVDLWRAVVKEYGGTDAVDSLDGMLAGRPIFPVADAFGACLMPQSTTIGVFNLGYSTSMTSDGKWLVTHVDAKAPAGLDGLLAGDQILEHTDTSAVFSSPHRVMNLWIRRGQHERTLSFLPRTGAVSAVEWKPRSGDVDAPCPEGEQASQ